MANKIPQQLVAQFRSAYESYSVDGNGDAADSCANAYDRAREVLGLEPQFRDRGTGTRRWHITPTDVYVKMAAFFGVDQDPIYTVFEGSDIEASFPATEDGWKMALAYRDDTLAKYDAQALAKAGVVIED
jgi:hypothetical protein